MKYFPELFIKPRARRVMLMQLFGLAGVLSLVLLQAIKAFFFDTSAPSRCVTSAELTA